MNKLIAIFLILGLSSKVSANTYSAASIAIAYRAVLDTPETSVNLPFPIYDYYDYTQQTSSPINFADPDNIKTEVIYNPETGMYEIYQMIGGMYYRYPTAMTQDEYIEYQRKKAESDYFAEMSDAEYGRDEWCRLIFNAPSSSRT